MSEDGVAAGPALDNERMHALRNAINSANLCVHAAEQLLIAGHGTRAMDHLTRALHCLARARGLLASPADAA